MHVGRGPPVLSVVLDVVGTGQLTARRVEVPGLFEVGQHAVPAPGRLLAKVGAPAVVVFLLAAVDLHTVDAGAATKQHAADDVDGAAIEAGLGDRREVELDGGIEDAKEALAHYSDKGRIFWSGISPCRFHRGAGVTCERDPAREQAPSACRYR